MPHSILIVDDADINLVLFSTLVKRLPDCQAITFADPLKALEWTQTHSFDLLIVDYMMPELDGIAFIERLRQLPLHVDVPVLMITANDQKQVRYRALDAGVTDFLTKPVDKIELLARANNLLQLGLSRRALRDRATWLVEEVRKATLELVEQEHDTVVRLSKAAEYRDPDTGAHILRMAHYSRLIAEQLGLDAAACELILKAAPMHDIGKVGIPDLILLKPGRLTSEEFELMKQHATYGYEILRGSRSGLLQAGAEIARLHHEKWDGSGYPQGLAGEAIALKGRIVAVADVFDAITSERPYKKDWDLERAQAFLLEGRGSHFDPACVDAFLARWSEVLAIRQRYADQG